MTSLREKQIRAQIERIFGDSPVAEEMKRIVLKANTEGFTPEEIEAYTKQKEEDIRQINLFFAQEPIEETKEEIPLENRTIYGRIISNEILEEDAKITTDEPRASND